VGTGEKKMKAVDLSLGSESTQLVKETKQNERIIEKLLSDAADMNKKLDDLGLPLDVIKEEFFGSKDPKKKKLKSPRRGMTLSASKK
jgi:hypothetical protein